MRVGDEAGRSRRSSLGRWQEPAGCHPSSALQSAHQERPMSTGWNVACRSRSRLGGGIERMRPRRRDPRMAALARFSQQWRTAGYGRLRPLKSHGMRISLMTLNVRFTKAKSRSATVEFVTLPARCDRCPSPHLRWQVAHRQRFRLWQTSVRNAP